MNGRRGFTPARIVALAVIGAILAGLAYLRITGGDDPVSVPAGARAGDLTMHACTYPTEAGALAADCGTLVVPENRSDPGSRLIALPLTRIRAGSAHPAEPIFRLEGGPGITNMTFPQASRFVGGHDLVLVGYRGVDGSSRLDCPEVSSVLRHSPDFLAASSIRARGEAFRECADRLQRDGVDLAGFTLAQRIDDMEAARKALGYDRIDLLSESAGTRAAMAYGWTYPASIHRSVMVGVNPPGHFVWDPATTDAQIERYARLCAADAGCGARTADLAATMRAVSKDIPDHWLFLPIATGNVRAASFFGLMDSSSEAAPVSGPMTVDAWLSAAGGDASGFWLQSLLGRMAFADAFVWGDDAAIAMEDARAADAYFASSGDDHSILGNAGSEFLWADGALDHAWPATPRVGEFDHVRPSDVETLLIGGTLDFSTPPNFATDELLPSLPNGHQVVLSEFGHTTDFWNEQRGAGTHLITRFLDSGEVDASRYVHRDVEFHVSMSQGGIAKIVLGSMATFALLMVVVLIAIGFRYRRGGVGPKTGAVIRSVGPLLFGFGGWFLGALVVMSLRPSVPLDDPLFATIAVGVPIWLGVFAGWASRRVPLDARRAGFWIAGAASVAGGWLGFHATSGLLSLITTIAGAAVAVNLALIAFDIRRERRGHGTPAPISAEVRRASSGREQPVLR